VKKEQAELKIFASDNVAGLRKMAEYWLGKALFSIH
jgi:hypothetical protein